MLDDVFPRWTRAVQSHDRLTVGWIRAYEHEPRRHIHAVLMAGGALDCFHAQEIWQQSLARRSSLAAIVQPYRYGVGGLAYILKSIDGSKEDLQFSENMTAFVPNGALRSFGGNSVERRHIRRIMAQTQSRSNYSVTSSNEL